MRLSVWLSMNLVVAVTMYDFAYPKRHASWMQENVHVTSNPAFSSYQLNCCLHLAQIVGNYSDSRRHAAGYG